MANIVRKKSTSPRRRRRKGLSSGGVKRRKSTRRKGLLSDMFNPTIAMNSFKNSLVSSAGGFGAVLVNKSILPSGSGKITRVLTGLGVGFVASAFGMPQLGSGFAGGMAALTFQNGLLNDDDASFADEDVLSDNPMVLDENGTPMILEENDGDPFYRYMSEDEMMAYQNTY